MPDKYQYAELTGWGGTSIQNQAHFSQFRILSKEGEN